MSTTRRHPAPIACVAGGPTQARSTRRSTKIPSLLCPSTDAKAANQTIFVLLHNYGPMNDSVGTAYYAGYSRAAFPEWTNGIGLTNYLGVAGGMGTIPTNTWDRFRGPFGNRTKNSFRDIRDGTARRCFSANTWEARHGRGPTLRRRGVCRMTMPTPGSAAARCAPPGA